MTKGSGVRDEFNHRVCVHWACRASNCAQLRWAALKTCSAFCTSGTSMEYSPVFCKLLLAEETTKTSVTPLHRCFPTAGRLGRHHPSTAMLVAQKTSRRPSQGETNTYRWPTKAVPLRQAHTTLGQPKVARVDTASDKYRRRA